MITSGSPKERENEQQDAGQSQSSCSIREIARELAAMGYTNKRGGVMRPRMQVSFLSDCDDVALPALKLDPDAEMARVVLADVEVRQRAVLHDVEGSCDDRF
jgi:hypothetical protein